MVAIEVVPEHGYVALVAVASYFIHGFYMAIDVMNARKKYKVDYPALYASAENSPKSDEAGRKAFNCVQRAHQNSCENLASFYALLGVAGTKYPITAAISGAIYLAGRIAYFKGYSTGDPDKRQKGAFLHIGVLALAGTAIKVAWDLLKR